MIERKIELTKCPKCGATCKVGHDDDFQVYCACCETSFVCKEAETKVTIDEYRQMKEKANEIYKVGAWVAFK